MRQYILAAMILVLATGLASAANVTVTQIKASGSGGKATVDPKLADIAESISKRFTYSKYEFLSSKSSTVAKGSTSTWDLSTGNKLDVTLSATETEGKSVRYTLDIEVYKQTPKGKESIMKTTVKLPGGTTFLLGLGEANGWTLILAFKVEEPAK